MTGLAFCDCLSNCGVSDTWNETDLRKHFCRNPCVCYQFHLSSDPHSQQVSAAAWMFTCSCIMPISLSNYYISIPVYHTVLHPHYFINSDTRIIHVYFMDKDKLKGLYPWSTCLSLTGFYFSFSSDWLKYQPIDEASLNVKTRSHSKNACQFLSLHHLLCIILDVFANCC